MPPRYHTDPYTAECTASVLEVLELEGRFHLRLDDTLFYPEGGGQPADGGTVDSIPVIAVYEDESGVWVVTEVMPHTDRPVPCRLDMTRRFDHMQQHSGQHLLSAVMSHLYDNGTVGFRLTEEDVTIDLAKRLSPAEIEAAEAEANRLILENLPLRALMPDPETLNSLPLRKQPQVSEDIRVIEIDGYDYSPCCGTHVRATGEIGLIKIVRFENYKSGVRLTFRCGQRALAHYAQMNRLVHVLSQQLSSPPEMLLEAFERFQNERQALKEELLAARTQLDQLEAAAWLDAAEQWGAVRLVVRRETRPLKELKELTNRMAQEPAVIAVIGSTADGKAQLLLQRSAGLPGPDLKVIFAAAAPLINGKGGGNATAAQGGGDGTEGLEACMAEAVRLIKEQVLLL